MRLKLTQDQEYLYRQLEKAPRGSLPAEPTELFQTFIDLGQAYLLFLATPEARDEILKSMTTPVENNPTMNLALFWRRIMDAGQATTDLRHVGR